MVVRVILILSFYLLILNNIFAASNIDKAYSYFQDEQYQQALHLYSLVKSYSASMGQGNSAYRLENFKLATQFYTEALLKAKNDTSKKNALYNMANAYYKNNELIKSIETYKYLLNLHPDFDDAQNNLWSAQSMLIDLLKLVPRTAESQSSNYDPQNNRELNNPFDEKIDSQTEKIGYLRSLIGDRVAEGELNAILKNTDQIDNLISKSRQIKNYLLAVKKLEFVNDYPQLILKSIINFENNKYSN